MQNIYAINQKKLSTVVGSIITTYLTYKVVENYYIKTPEILENSSYIHNKGDANIRNNKISYPLVFIAIVVLFLLCSYIIYNNKNDEVINSNYLEDSNSVPLTYESWNTLSAEVFQENSEEIPPIIIERWFINDDQINMLITIICSVIICGILLYMHIVIHIDMENFNILDSLVKPTLTVSNYNSNSLEGLQEYTDKSTMMTQITIILTFTYIMLAFFDFYHSFTGITIMFILHMLFNLRKDDDVIYINTANKYTIITEIFILIHVVITSILSNNFILSIFQYHNVFSCVLLFVEIIRFKKNKNYNPHINNASINFSQDIIYYLNIWSNLKILFIHSILILSLSIFNGLYTTMFVFVQCAYIFYRYYISITFTRNNHISVTTGHYFKSNFTIAAKDTTSNKNIKIFYKIKSYNSEIMCSTNLSDVSRTSFFVENIQTFSLSRIFNNKTHYFFSDHQDDDANIKSNYDVNFILREDELPGIYNEIHSGNNNSQKVDVELEYLPSVLYGKTLPIYFLRIINLYSCWDNCVIDLHKTDESIKSKKNAIIQKIIDIILKEILNIEFDQPLDFNYYFIQNPNKSLKYIIKLYILHNIIDEKSGKFYRDQKIIKRNLDEFVQDIHSKCSQKIKQKIDIRKTILPCFAEKSLQLQGLEEQQARKEEQVNNALEAHNQEVVEQLNEEIENLFLQIAALKIEMQNLKDYIEINDIE